MAMADGIGLRASTNIDEVFAQIDAFVASVHDVAIPRAINKLIGQAKVVGLRRLNDIYGIGPRTFEQYVSIDLARDKGFEASINVKGKGLPLVLFKPQRVRGKGGGVIVTVKGRRVFIPHAFIATMPSGHRGVFARGAYGGKGRIEPTGKSFGRFAFGKKRFSINELFTFSPPKAFSNDLVIEAMNDRMVEQAPKVIAQEIRFASR